MSVVKSYKNIKPGLRKSAERLEDYRFLTGQARYTSDINLNHQLYAVIVRSIHAHAAILSIDTKIALEIDGVIGVHTVTDLDEDGIKCMPCPAAGTHLEFCVVPPRSVLARDFVRHVGDPVAFVVAKSLASAKLAAEKVKIRYEPLPATPDIKSALLSDSPKVWALAPENFAFFFIKGNQISVNKVFKAADHVVEIEVINNRVCAVPMEPRAGIGAYDAKNCTYSLTSTSQGLHSLRDQLAKEIFGVDSDHFTLRAPDVGGGFGLKNALYPEWILLPWAAKRHGQPVKWVGERSEDFLAAVHGRDSIVRAALALSAGGKFLALKCDVVGNMGAYLSSGSPGVLTKAFPTALGGIYDIKHVYLESRGVFTNTAPVDAYRGAGKPEANFITERLIEKAAKNLEFDPVELRRLNAIKHFPHTTALGVRIDSGRFRENITEAERLSDRDQFEVRRRIAANRGLLRGLGFACFLETARGTPEEGAEITFARDGVVELRMGTESNGQGHETTFAHIASEILCLPIDTFKFINADTALTRMGHGHGGARSMHMGGAALIDGLNLMLKKASKIAAQHLQVNEEDINFESSVFNVKGNRQSISLKEVIRQAGSSLNTFAHVEDAPFTFPNGCHVAEVEVDPETGNTEILHYISVDDYGNIVNPELTKGQVVGGIAQGIGQAIGEFVTYDSQTGQLISGSLMDYLVPRATNLPDCIVHFQGSATNANSLGVKGAGQAGAIAAPQTIVNAILNALSPLGVEHIDMPLTSETVWQAIQMAKMRKKREHKNIFQL